MVESDCVERAEARQVVLVWRIVPVPRHHVERRKRLRHSPDTIFMSKAPLCLVSKCNKHAVASTAKNRPVGHMEHVLAAAGSLAADTLLMPPRHKQT